MTVTISIHLYLLSFCQPLLLLFFCSLLFFFLGQIFLLFLNTRSAFSFCPNPKFREPFALLLLLLRFCFTNLLINQYTFHFFFPLISFMASFRLPPLRLFIRLFFFTDLLHTKIYSQAMNSISKSPASGDLTSKTDDFFPGSFLEVSDVGSHGDYRAPTFRRL
ncbi:hypothetical protein HID58_060398 [Brassica napus]|uniref:Uncharacterized protein n=1 Tax=Brassica napus TaxID=3708 RepID=A0ABQ7ZW89_BRANA|nr:hypothetical protein HID58_060398 [Brassica napus]